MAEIYKIGSDNLVDRISQFGGTNLLITTANLPYSTQSWSSWFIPAANTSNSCLAGFHDFLFPEGTKVGDQFIFSFDFEWTKYTAASGQTLRQTYIQWYANGSWSTGIATPLPHTDCATAAELISGNGSKKIIIKANITAENQITANWWANFRTDYSDGTGKFRIRNFKLERSNYVGKQTDWTPAPQDLIKYDNESLVFFQ